MSYAWELYKLGFNVIPVGKKGEDGKFDWKAPRVKWSSERRAFGELKSSNAPPPKDFVKAFSGATGIAIAAGPENPFKKIGQLLVIFDIDRPSILDRLPRLNEWIGKTVSWRSGLRCPRCESKNVEVFIDKDGSRKLKCGDCGAEFPLEQAKRGMGAMFFIDRDVANRLGLRGTERYGDVEVLVTNYALIPPSRHPTGVDYEWIRPIDVNSRSNYGIVELKEDAAAEVLGEVRGLRGAAQQAQAQQAQAPTEAQAERPRESCRELRKLGDEDIQRAYSALKDVYRKGLRQSLIFYLSGYAAQACVHPLSVVQLVVDLHNKLGDEDPMEQRLAAVTYTYRKHGVDIAQFEEDIKRIAGVERVTGSGGPLPEERLAGRGSLLQLLEDAFRAGGLSDDEAESKAYAVLAVLSEAFKAPPPFRGVPLMAVVDFAKRKFVVNDVRRKMCVLATLDEKTGRLVWGEFLGNCAVTRIVRYTSKLGGGKPLYELEVATPNGTYTLGPALWGAVEDEALRTLLLAGVDERRFRGGLRRIVQVAELSGMVEESKTYPMTGFVYDPEEGKVIPNGVDASRPKQDELRAALQLLDDIANKWYSDRLDIFAAVVRWFLTAPFDFARKLRRGGVRKMFKNLYIVGPKATGKTALAELGLGLWGLAGDVNHDISGASVDTKAKLGIKLSSTTLPVVINEPGDLFNGSGLIDMIKSSAEGLMARERALARGREREHFYAAAPMAVTSNRLPPVDDPLTRRFMALRLSLGHQFREKDERVKRFEQEVAKRFNELSPIGSYVAWRVVSDPSLLDLDEDDFAVKMLEEAYREAGLTPPSWVRLAPGDALEDLGEQMGEMFRAFLLGRINDAYTTYIAKIGQVRQVGEDRSGEVVLTKSLAERVTEVAGNSVIPWLSLKYIRGEAVVVITSGVLAELSAKVPELGITSLRDLAQLADPRGERWRYEPKLKVKDRVVSAVVVGLDDLVDYLEPG